MIPLHRRDVLRGGASLATALALPATAWSAPSESAPASGMPPSLRFAVKYGMVSGDAPLAEKFRLLARLGYDGVELDSPNQLTRRDVLAAQDASGLAVHGVVDSIHWRVRLSDHDPQVRKQAQEGLITALRDSQSYGGSSVLLVPGMVSDPRTENEEQVFERSIEGIRAALPVAAELGVHILIENVWNRFLYDHDGPADQSAEKLAAYLDEIASPWVGSYFDIGNHQKYGQPGAWLRTLGRRVVKLDVKDWGVESGWAKIGDGDVDWADVRRALADIGFHGWATAEVGGGDEERLTEILERMRRVLVA